MTPRDGRIGFVESLLAAALFCIGYALCVGSFILIFLFAKWLWRGMP